MLVLSKNEIKKIFSMKMAIETTKEALGLYSKGQSTVPLRTVVDIPSKGAQNLYMPALIESRNASGIKIVSVFPTNIAKQKPVVLSQMILLDGETGEICAVIDGTYLTQLRTGALQGAATDILAKKDAKIGALFGTGGQASAQLEAMLVTRNFKEVRVFDISFERAKLFVEQMKKEFGHLNVQFIPVSNSEDAIKNADVITAVTTSKKPVFDGNLVHAGTHINGIGAYTPDMQELPASLIQNADKLVFDTNNGVLAEAGDILIPMNAGLVSAKDFHGELGEIVLGQKLGRENEDEITVFKSVGTAVLDLLAAQKIYLIAKEQNIGTNVVF